MQRSTEIRLIKEIIGLAEQQSAYLDDRIAESPIMRYTDEGRFNAKLRAVAKSKPKGDDKND